MNADFTVDAATTKKICNPLPSGSYCFAQCKEGRIFVKSQQSPWYVCTGGNWQPTPDTVPDCVGKIYISL